MCLSLLKMSRVWKVPKHTGFIIPIKPTPRLVPWEKGEEAATAYGINARKHRETAEHLFQVKSRRLPGHERADEIYAPPSQNPIYQRAMDAIKAHQGQFMRAVMQQTTATSLEAFRESNPAEMYALDFIVEELIEKDWLSSKIEYHAGGFIVLIVDFSQ